MSQFVKAPLVCLLIAGSFAPAYSQSVDSSANTREAELLERIRRLEERISALEHREAPASAQAPTTAAAAPVVPDHVPQSAPVPIPNVGGTTFNVNFDGYYGYNFNRPAGRVNLLRAYDVTSNNLSINQAGIVIERAPDIAAGRRFGLRLDLMFGQATETLQGGAQNEPRPQVYRNVFQAYGTYVIPAGKGLTVDFGKFSSSLGYEGNYTKDQINYSRSYWFNFLPFYHMGFRSTYNLTDKVSVTNWIVNGANQTDDFNGFKSTAFLVNIKPASNLSWNVNYYVGREQRDLTTALNPGLPTLPTQPGLSMTPIDPSADGRYQVVDTYAAWNATDKLMLVGEFDTVLNRAFRNSPPTRATGGAAYARFQFTPAFSLGGRFELLKDSGGLFSGASQTLKDTTLTATYQFASGFQTKLEYRRDYSNVPFFLTEGAGPLKKEQNTATLGLIWWFGGKDGGW